MSPDDPRHGTRRGYYAHRKDGEQACDACKRGAAAAEARRHLPGASRRIDPTGTGRRVQALIALGWTYLDIERATGLQDAELRRFALGHRAYVYSSTHAKVDAAYRRLCMVVPPSTNSREKQARTKARNIARRHGWLPPLAWDDIDDPAERPNHRVRDLLPDDVAIDRVLDGDFTIRLTRAERLEVVRRWRDSDNELERRSGWNVARLRRYLARPTEEVA